MIWAQIAWFVVSVIVSYALGPKPPKPRPAALEDFDIPVAEEDRPIPVVFGEVEITGPNVLWYGNLSTKAIKEGNMFGSSTVGYKYYLGFHMALCHGPVDAVTMIRVAEKEVWSGNATANTTLTISKPELFGGKKREGGLEGRVDLMFGAGSQTANAYLENTQGGLGTVTIPAYRGVLSLVARGDSTNPLGRSFYVGTTPYLKPWAVTVRRILQGWQGGSAWYPSKAVIGTKGMNGAHIIYECLTNSEWGMGEDPGMIDESTFMDVADTLFDEGFGLRMMWNQSDTIENFIRIVLDHIAGQLTINHATGKYQLRLFRADYDPDDLDVFDESDIRAITEFQRQLWGETINELVLVYTDPATQKLTAVTAQDLANIQSQGARISEKLTLSGIADHDLANLVVIRELQARSTPLAKVTFQVNRRFWTKVQGDVFKLSWSRLGLEEVIFRVLTIRGGVTTRGWITVEAIEDVFGMPGSSYSVQQGETTDEAPPPTPIATGGTGPNVISTSTTAPPSSPADGDRYYVPTGATGAWAGHAGQVAEWDEAEGEWIFIDIPPGTVIVDESNGSYHSVNSSGELEAAPWDKGLLQIRTHSSSDSTTLAITDAGKVLEMNRAGANTVTFPNHSSVAIPVNSSGLIRQMGAGQTTIVPGPGVTIRTPATLRIRAQYGMISWHKRDTNEFCIEGNLEQ